MASVTEMVLALALVLAMLEELALTMASVPATVLTLEVVLAAALALLSAIVLETVSVPALATALVRDGHGAGVGTRVRWRRCYRRQCRRQRRRRRWSDTKFVRIGCFRFWCFGKCSGADVDVADGDGSGEIAGDGVVEGVGDGTAVLGKELKKVSCMTLAFVLGTAFEELLALALATLLWKVVPPSEKAWEMAGHQNCTQRAFSFLMLCQMHRGRRWRWRW